MRDVADDVSRRSFVIDFFGEKGTGGRTDHENLAGEFLVRKEKRQQASKKS
jgi:hypothetical protein